MDHSKDENSDAAEVSLWARALDKALSIQQHVVDANLRRVRRTRPDAAADQLLGRLEKEYLAAVATTGAGAGAAAAAPGVGTGLAIAVGATEAAAFLQASVLHVLCVAEVCGVKIDDLERRRSVVLAILLGDSGAQTVRKMAERTGAHWGRQLVERVPLQTIRRINGVLGRNFVTKYGTRQGVIVLGRLAPFGIGAAIGGGANAMIGYGVVGATRRAFADDLAAGGTVE